MSVSSFLGSRIALLVPHFSTKKFPLVEGNSNAGLVIENSSRPKKKGTAHHMKTRPRKTQPWDVNRKPTVYAPLPPDWTIVTNNSDSVSVSGGGAAVPSPADLQAPLASG